MHNFRKKLTVESTPVPPEARYPLKAIGKPHQAEESLGRIVSPFVVS